MAIFLNKKTKKWKAEVWFKQKRIITKSFSNKALAEKFERETLLNIEKRMLSGSQAQDYTYNELFNFWKSSSSWRKTERSVVKDVQMNKSYVEPIIGHLKTSELSVIHFEKIVSNILKKGLTKTTANLVIQHFKAVLNYAFNNDFILRNPAKGFKQLKLEKKEMDYLSQHELERLLSYTNKKYIGEERWKHILYLTLFLTGGRLGEVLGLELSKFYFDRDVLIFSQMWDGTTQKIIDTTKGKKDRLVPLNSILKAELISIKNKAESKFIFTYCGTRPIDPSSFRSKVWDKDFKAAGIKRIRIHDARHTFASLFMMNGGKLYDLKAILGHSDMKTTERYAHLSNDHLAGVKDIIKPNIENSGEVYMLNTLRNKSSRLIHAHEADVLENIMG